MPTKKVQVMPGPARSNQKVALAWIAGGETSMLFTTSLALTLVKDMATDRHVVNVLNHWSGVNVSDARNFLTNKFLDEVPTAEWLLWVDADMQFEPDDLHNLVESADPVERPIMGALCFGEDADRGLFPTLYAFQMTPEGETQSIRLSDYPDDTLFEVAATGTAFLLIHRSVLEAMRERKFSATYPFFQELEMNGRPVGEDIGFCARARSLGFPVFVNTGVQIGHHKPHVLDAAMFRRQQGARMVASPATERIDVIVPTLGRPQNAKRFMDSLRASTGLATAYAMCDEDDVASQDAWREAGAIVYTGKHTFPEKCNLGLKASEGSPSPWVLIVGDDVEFRPGWWDEAFEAAGDTYDVIGTNDLGNPRVVAGEHATHIVLRRSYIDKVGGSWDGPGSIAHEAYKHWFVDDEIVQAAKQRGVWTSAHKSVIEHFHPAWGKAPDDETYRHSQEGRFTDEVLFRKRQEEFYPERDG